MNITNIATCLPIVVICYVFGILLKSLAYINDNSIPVLVAICGGILGVIALFAMPGFPADDVITAIAVGMASGLTATGSNQIYKQIKKFKEGE